ARVVGEKGLGRRVQLEAAQAQLADRPLQLLERQGALPGVDRGEADELIRVGLYHAGHIVVPNVGHAGGSLGVDIEDHAKDVERLIILIHLLRRAWHRPGLEVAGQLLFLQRRRVARRNRNMNMDVYGTHRHLAFGQNPWALYSVCYTGRRLQVSGSRLQVAGPRRQLATCDLQLGAVTLSSCHFVTPEQASLQPVAAMLRPGYAPRVPGPVWLAQHPL